MHRVYEASFKYKREEKKENSEGKEKTKYIVTCSFIASWFCKASLEPARHVYLHLVQYVLKVVAGSLDRVGVRALVRRHHNRFVLGESLDLLLYVAPLMSASVVASAGRG